MEVNYRNRNGTPGSPRLGTPHIGTPQLGWPREETDEVEPPHHHRHHHHNQTVLRKLRRWVSTDDPLYLGLHKLKIHGKDLGSLPDEVFLIDELEVLDLSPERQSCLYYQLSYLPPAIGRLLNLKILILDTNELEELPPEVCLLSSLERFCISNNHLVQLPKSFNRLKKLKSLHAANNKFKEFALSLCQLPLLEFLDVSDNRIQEIPPQISDLTNLMNLIVVFNRLKALPETLCDLKELRVLWIGHNKIRSLPKKFGQLRNLDWGYRHTSSSAIDGNPMESPPVEVCKRGVDAIARYFASPPKEKGEAEENKQKSHGPNGDRADPDPDQSVSLPSLNGGSGHTSRTESQNDQRTKPLRGGGDRSHRNEPYEETRQRLDNKHKPYGQSDASQNRVPDNQRKNSTDDTNRTPEAFKPRGPKSRVRAKPGNRQGDTNPTDVTPLNVTSPTRRR